MGEQRLPESHSISSFSFSEMQLGRPEHHVGSAMHGCLAGAVGVLGLQAGVHHLEARLCMHHHTGAAWSVCTCINARSHQSLTSGHLGRLPAKGF